MASVEISYASEDQQLLLAIEVDLPCSVKQAIEQSGILQQFPEIDLTTQSVGIFARKAALETQLESGDRIEIYRPLIIEPTEARRLRALRKK